MLERDRSENHPSGTNGYYARSHIDQLAQDLHLQVLYTGQTSLSFVW